MTGQKEQKNLIISLTKIRDMELNQSSGSNKTSVTDSDDENDAEVKKIKKKDSDDENDGGGPKDGSYARKVQNLRGGAGT